MIFYDTNAYNPLDPTGNITIKWDVVSWTVDGYVVSVFKFFSPIYHLPKYSQATSQQGSGYDEQFPNVSHIMSPGRTLGWNWPKKEVIWSMVGAQTTEQGDCSKFKANIPHCCKKNPIVVDLLPRVPYNQQIANLRKGWSSSIMGARSCLQQQPHPFGECRVAGTSNKMVKLPRNFTLLGPGPGILMDHKQTDEAGNSWQNLQRRMLQIHQS
ncbi:hypothetical protein IFM89_037910, partial [Coptis chinensis]